MAWQNGNTQSLTNTQRKKIMRRDNNTCQKCGDTAHEIDHITPRHKGGTDKPENLRALCRACHHRKTMTESLNARKQKYAASTHPKEQHPGIITH